MALNIIIEGQATLGVTTGMPASIEVQMGTPGASATVNVGTTTTGDAGTDALVENVGTASAAILNFTIPRGDQGEQGNPGTPGTPGTAATINVGTTTTGAAGSSASVTNSGSTSAAIFNFTIPRGDKGDAGTPGQGVPSAGTAGQVLAKIDSSNYSTHWVTPTVAWGQITGGIASQTDLQNALDEKLSLTGGTMANGANLELYKSITPEDPFASPSLIVRGEGTNDEGNYRNNFTEIQAGQIILQGDGESFFQSYINCYWGFKHTGLGGGIISINGDTGITFPDGSTQASAYNPDVLNGYLPLTGGTMSGNIVYGTEDELTNNVVLGSGGLLIGYDYNNYRTVINPNYLYFHEDVNNGSLTINATNGYYFNNSQGNVSLNYSGVSGYDDGISWGIGSSGVTFPDGSTQATAYNPDVLNGYLPLTGGTMADNTSIILNDTDNNETATITGGQLTVHSNDNNTQTFINFINVGASNVTTGQSLYFNSAGIHFPDSTVQTTAFPGYTGTTSQYIRGDGTLETYGPLGDRYSTTSTTSLTISNGTKTLTIGTGLSYSQQQEIVIAYDSNNHMHATVTSYNSTTGVMVADVHQKAGSGTYALWSVNLGGAAGGSYLAIANNLSELTATASTARTNLGLGTMATATATDYLSKAGNLSGLASTATSRSNLGLGAVATDAYATTAQAQAGTSTTTVINPSTLLDAKYFQGGKYVNTIVWTSATSGTGAGAFAQNANGRYANAPTSATGYGINSAIICNNSRGSIFNSGFDFSKRIIFGGRFARNVVTPDTNSVFRYSIGKSSSTDASDLSARGLMIKVAGSGALQLLVHNGTTLTTTTSSFTPSNGVSYDVIVVSDGSGNATLYVNGSSVATSTGGPTSAGSTNAGQLTFETQNTSTLSNSAMSICGSDFFVQVNS